MPLQNFTVLALTACAERHSWARCMLPRPTWPVTTTLFQVLPNAAAAASCLMMSGLASGRTSMPERW